MVSGMLGLLRKSKELRWKLAEASGKRAPAREHQRPVSAPPCPTVALVLVSGSS